jgi:hypothetical protein
LSAIAGGRRRSTHAARAANLGCEMDDGARSEEKKQRGILHFRTS